MVDNSKHGSLLRNSIPFLLLMTVALLLGACASAPKPILLEVQVSAAADVNPDRQGRPSPVVLHILELATDAQFNRLDYRSLAQSAESSLGTDLLSKDQVVLQPGESRSIPLELNAQASFMGFLAGYQDNDNSVWRASLSITPGVTKTVSVTLQQQQVVATASN
jgi:type VI secretion system protein VasD